MSDFLRESYNEQISRAKTSRKWNRVFYSTMIVLCLVAIVWFALASMFWWIMLIPLALNVWSLYTFNKVDTRSVMFWENELARL